MLIDLIFFLLWQKKRIYEGGNYKEHRSKKIDEIVVKYAKNCGRAQWDPPLAL